jgi:hypothetical protein
VGAAVIFLLPVLLVIASVGPGVIAVRGMRLGKVERLVAGVGVSLFLVFVAGFFIYLINGSHAWYWGVEIACAAATVLAMKDLRRLVSSRAVRTVLLHVAMLWAWFMLLSLTIRNFSGGLTALDWVEHYERAIFFLDHLPYDYKFVGLWLLPARPPMMNGLSTHFLALTGASFEAHQVVFVYLNCLAALPCYLFARRFGGKRWSPWLVTLLLALNPYVAHNATVGWTKLFTAFYVLAGLWFYLRGWERRNVARIIGGFALLAIGMLVHYSAGPYIVVLALHAIVTLPRRIARRPWALAGAGAAMAAIVIPWFVWSAVIYKSAAVASNSAVTDAARFSVAKNLRKVAYNVNHTLVPFSLTMPYSDFHWILGQPTRYGTVRDYACLMYQNELVPAMGSAGGVIIIYLLCAKLWRARRGAFWIYFLVGSVLLGIAVHGDFAGYGVAQICLAPVVLLGISFLAAMIWRMNAAVRVVLLASVAVDLALGIFLQFYCSSCVFHFVDPRHSAQISIDADTMSPIAFVNYTWKMHTGFSFLADHVPAAVSFGGVVVIGVGMLLMTARELLGGKRMTR